MKRILIIAALLLGAAMIVAAWLKGPITCHQINSTQVECRQGAHTWIQERPS